MSQQPPDSQPSPQVQGEDHREPDDSPQRRLVETVEAYEVDPPAPSRARDDDDRT